METLNYAVLANAGYPGYILRDAPEKVLQFGEGNFLRAFVDHWFDLANERTPWKGKVLVIKPRDTAASHWQRLNDQQGLYTLHLRGLENGQIKDESRVISSISQCLNPYTPQGYRQMMAAAVSPDLELVVSNTTEAGIVFDPACALADCPASSFPGKLTQVLYARYRAGRPGLVILPCELNDNNGDLLRDCVLAYARHWALEDGFVTYLREECVFCNTLVDRIVPGGARDLAESLDARDGYRDELRVMAECFGIWNIEGPETLRDKLPFLAAAENCTLVPDVTPYKKRKVRILNGAHTGCVLGAYLAGHDLIRDCMEDPVILAFMNRMLSEEVLPTLPLAREELESFTAAVRERFCNPFVDHRLLSISLNSTAKWRARLLPTLLDRAAAGELPRCIAMTFAMYLAFYTQDVQGLSDLGLHCRRAAGDGYCCSDDGWVLEFYRDHAAADIPTLVHAVMTNTRMWGMDLTKIPGFEETVVRDLHCLRSQGPLAAFRSCL